MSAQRSGHKPVSTEVLIALVAVAMVLGALIWRTRPGAAAELHPIPLLAGMVAFPTDAARSPFIRFEAEDADLIEPSFKVKPDPACSGAQYVSLPEEAGSLWTKSGVGRMQYTVTIPEAGEYALWGRVKWESGCSCQLDVDLGGAKAIIRPTLLINDVRKNMGTGRFGKDTTLEAWHWLGQDTYQLPAGKLTFTVTNLEDGVAIDQWLITSDIQFKPRGEDPLLARETFTKGHEAAGWRYDPQTWTIMAEGERAALVKSDDTITPACLAVSKPVAGHTQFTWTESGICRIYQSLVDDRNFDVVESLTSSVRFRRYRNGRVEREETASISGVMPLDTHTMEVFRDGEKLVVMRDHEIVLRADGLPIADGLIGVDVGAKGRILSGVFQPKTAIHESDYFYFPWGGRYLTAANGTWKPGNEYMAPATDNATVIGGEDWWRDLQFTAVVCPPSEGTWSMAVCYRDAANQLQLAFEGNQLTLTRWKRGVQTVLGTGVSKTWRADQPNRITIKRPGDKIAIFANGTFLFDATDTESYAGKVALSVTKDTVPKTGTAVATSAPSAKAKPGHPLRLYDSFVTSLSEGNHLRTQEDVTWFKRPHRIITCVLDSLGATGGHHPGDYRFTFTEPFINAWENKLRGETGTRPVYGIDGQFLTTDQQAFAAHHGLGKGPGFIVGKPADPARLNYLWPIESVLGDNEYRFAITGTPDTLGVMWVGVTDPATVPQQEILCGMEMEPSKGRVRLRGTSDSDAKSMTWPALGEHEIRVRHQAGRLVVMLDEHIILDEAVPALPRRPLKPILYYAGGKPVFDDLSVLMYPDRNYEFNKNLPVHIAYGEWEVKADTQVNSGSYYFREHFKGDPARLLSREFMTGNTAMGMRLSFRYNKMSSFGVCNSMAEYRVRMEPNRMQLVHHVGDKATIVAEAPLAKSDSFRRTLTYVWLTIESGTLSVFTSDEEQMDRCILSHKLEGFDGAYRMFIEGTPWLELANILLWNRPTKG